MGRYDYYGGWRPYVPVAERRRKAASEMEKLRKKGLDVQPVEIEGRAIARSFWGKAWCDHMDSFGDYANRLPRGRTYVRNGSVCHLEIRQGAIEAIVSGSSLYHVDIKIGTLKPARWKALRKQCTGKIGSLVELLEGRLSDEIMRSVTDRRAGLFPQPGEISFDCDCPDWAGMCKHIAAVIYGVGARLDTRPELLFLLRGVDHGELLSAEAAAEAIVGKGTGRARRRKLAPNDLEEVFGVELDDETPAPEKPKRPRARKKTAPKKTPAAKKKTAAKKKPAAKKNAAAKKKSSRKPAPKLKKVPKRPGRPAAAPKKSVPKRKTAPFEPTGRSVAALRRRLGLSRSGFARVARVSPATVANWENASGAFSPRPENLAVLRTLHETISG
jgi:uncharacterized Zn finger protein